MPYLTRALAHQYVFGNSSLRVSSMKDCFLLHFLRAAPELSSYHLVKSPGVGAEPDLATAPSATLSALPR